MDLFFFSGSIRRESLDRRGQLSGTSALDCYTVTFIYVRKILANVSEKISLRELLVVHALWLYYICNNNMGVGKACSRKQVALN